MTFTGTVSSLIPGMMSLSVLGKSTQMIPTTGKYWSKDKKKANGKNVIKGFVPIIVGIPLIGATANLTSGL